MATEGAGVEVRSIDYVPLRERHGQLWHEREQEELEELATEHAVPAASA